MLCILLRIFSCYTQVCILSKLKIYKYALYAKEILAIILLRRKALQSNSRVFLAIFALRNNLTSHFYKALKKLEKCKYLYLYKHHLSSFASYSSVVMSLAKVKATVGLFEFHFYSTSRVFDICECYRRINTKFTVLKSDDPSCENISGTDFRWDYTSCNLLATRSWKVRKTFIFVLMIHYSRSLGSAVMPMVWMQRKTVKNHRHFFSSK